MKIIYKDGHVDECPQDQELHVIRHTAAHVMAQAIKRLYPEADFAFGPATENGFYYDVDLGDTKLTDEDLANIEKEMHKITKENLAIKPFILPRAEAVKLMEERHGSASAVTRKLSLIACISCASIGISSAVGVPPPKNTETTSRFSYRLPCARISAVSASTYICICPSLPAHEGKSQ